MEPLLLTLDLRDDNIFLNDAIVKALGYPAQIQLLINKVDRTIAVQACSMTDKEAIVIPHKPTAMLEISARDLAKRIRKLTGWDDDRIRVFTGESFPLYQAVQFYLDDALLIPEAQIQTNKTSTEITGAQIQKPERTNTLMKGDSHGQG